MRSNSNNMFGLPIPLELIPAVAATGKLAVNAMLEGSFQAKDAAFLAGALTIPLLLAAVRAVSNKFSTPKE